MPLFTKRPVTVEAHQFTAESRERVADWCNGHTTWNTVFKQWNLEIPTLEGTMLANEGDWIIRGVRGEFYPCKPHIFDETYISATGE
jgi:hypothetical protein